MPLPAQTFRSTFRGAGRCYTPVMPESFAPPHSTRRRSMRLCWLHLTARSVVVRQVGVSVVPILPSHSHGFEPTYSGRSHSMQGPTFYGTLGLPVVLSRDLTSVPATSSAPARGPVPRPAGVPLNPTPSKCLSVCAMSQWPSALPRRLIHGARQAWRAPCLDLCFVRSCDGPCGG
jgi:hypothetical protein